MSLQLWFKQLMVNFRKLYTAGYSLSLLTLTTALIILLSFRYRKCPCCATVVNFFGNKCNNEIQMLKKQGEILGNENSEIVCNFTVYNCIVKWNTLDWLLAVYFLGIIWSGHILTIEIKNNFLAHVSKTDTCTKRIPPKIQFVWRHVSHFSLTGNCAALETTYMPTSSCPSSCELFLSLWKTPCWSVTGVGISWNRLTWGRCSVTM